MDAPSLREAESSRLWSRLILDPDPPLACVERYCCSPKPPDALTILSVALTVRSKASRQASAGGHLSMKSENTEVAAKTVKSTSSMVWSLRQQEQVGVGKANNGAPYKPAPHNGRMPNRVEVGYARHKKMVRGQIGVVH